MKRTVLGMMPFEPTEGQQTAIDIFCEFMADRRPETAMVLRGSAGTGKTSVARAIVMAMISMRQKVVLMAPTGRAAKVLSMGLEGIRDTQGKKITPTTIHRRIYRQKAMDGEGGVFSLNDNLYADTLFIIDEASMIAPQLFAGEQFGTGSVLDDLVKYIYGGRNCRMMLIGDTAQLPPIGCDEAPALMTDVIAGYGLWVHDYDLMEVLRQSATSGILYNATMLRSLITYDDITQLPKITFDGYADIRVVMGDELIEQLNTSYHNMGDDETIVVTRSNKRCNIYNQGIRNMILGREDVLNNGDRLMVVKNNYGPDGKSFIANGDMAVVRRVRSRRQLYGFSFADVTLEFPDYEHMEIDTTVILDSLTSEAPSLTREQHEQLFAAVMEDYQDIPLKQDRMKKLREDCHFNALQIKYGYAITCHKAQGGQWADVYVDQGYMTDEMLTPSYIHWLYTAFTRATVHLYLVNWPKQQTLTPALSRC